MLKGHCGALKCHRCGSDCCSCAHSTINGFFPTCWQVSSFKGCSGGIVGKPMEFDNFFGKLFGFDITVTMCFLLRWFMYKGLLVRLCRSTNHSSAAVVHWK